jgi:hypothetical protein
LRSRAQDDLQNFVERFVDMDRAVCGTYTNNKEQIRFATPMAAIIFNVTREADLCPD